MGVGLLGLLCIGVFWRGRVDDLVSFDGLDGSRRRKGQMVMGGVDQ